MQFPWLSYIWASSRKSWMLKASYCPRNVLGWNTLRRGTLLSIITCAGSGTFSNLSEYKLVVILEWCSIKFLRQWKVGLYILGLRLHHSKAMLLHSTLIKTEVNIMASIFKCESLKVGTVFNLWLSKVFMLMSHLLGFRLIGPKTALM